MKFRILIYLMLIIFVPELIAQEYKTDSLEALLKGELADTGRLQLYIKLAMDLRDVNPVKGRSYGEQGIELLKTITNKDQNSRYGKKIMLGMGYILEKTGEYDSAEYYFRNSMNYTTEEDTMQLIGVYGGLGNLKRHATKYEEALDHYATHQELIKSCSYLKKSTRRTYLSSNLTNIGDIYLLTGKYVEARLQYEKALHILETIGDSVKMARAISRIGIIHYYNEEYQKAIDKTMEVIRLDSLLGNKARMVSNYNNVGLFYNNLNKPKRALAIHNRGLELTREIGNNSLIPSFLANIGLDYEKLNNPDTAVYLFSKSLEMASQNKNERQISESVFYLATTISKNPTSVKYLIGFDGFQDPISLIGKAIELAKEKNNLVFEKDSYLLLANVYEQKADYKNALTNYNLYQALKDSVYSKDKSKALADMEIKYETEKKEQQLALKDAELAQNELLISKQAIQRNGVILGSFLLIILAAVLYRNYRFKSKSNNEKEALLKEIHHRVKNNLQIIANLLYLQSGKFEDENIKNVLEEGQGRVRSMALIHQKLYENEDLKSIPFGEYILELVNEIKTSFGEQAAKVDVKVNAEEVFFDVDSAVPLGLIINELSTNAFKYAFEGTDAGQFNIFLTKSGDEYELHISDNGCGIPEEIDIRKTRSLGLRLVRVLSEQLEGNYSFETDNGMNFKLKFAA